MSEINCQCHCGKAKLRLATKPVNRFRCHCEICQRVYQQAFSDATILNAKQLLAIDHSLLRFESHWSWLQRGLCRHCQAPVVAFLALLPCVKVAIIPAQNYPAEAALPDVKAHIFYHRRQHDIDDDVPKISGFLLSELKAMQLIITGLWHR